MTKLKGIITIILIAVFATGNFANSIAEKAKNEIRKEIATHFQDVDLGVFDMEEATIQVTFLLNHKNEIVILSTDGSGLDFLVKSRLNYKTLRTLGTDKGKIYSVGIHIK